MGRRIAGRTLLALGTILIIAAAMAAGCATEMAERAFDTPPDPLETVDTDNACPVDWTYWLSVNPDVVGWIEVPGTSINLPIVQAQSDDPTFYLTHDVYGEWNYLGCPYVDAGCAESIGSRNVVVFGHNITYPPAMFHELEQYHDDAFAHAHREITVYSPASTRRLEVAGARTVGGWERVKRVDFANDADFAEYRDDLIGGCQVSLPPSKAGSQIFTFCTCSYFYNPANERTLVIAQ